MLERVASVQHRTEHDPVQGEIAFDPFALMDEQPESMGTVLVLKPEFRKSDPCITSEVCGPVARKSVRLAENPDLVTKIGCCGFPYLARARVNDETDESMDPCDSMPSEVSSKQSMVVFL